MATAAPATSATSRAPNRKMRSASGMRQGMCSVAAITVTSVGPTELVQVRGHAPAFQIQPYLQRPQLGGRGHLAPPGTGAVVPDDDFARNVRQPAQVEVAAAVRMHEMGE